MSHFVAVVGQRAHFVQSTIVAGDYYRASEKVKKSRRLLRKGPPPTSEPTSEPTVSVEEQSELMSHKSMFSQDVAEIVLTAVMDTGGHLLEIMFNRCVAIPRMLIQVIGLCIPYQHHLRRLTVRWGPLTTIALYEFSKFLFMSQLTEICLDDSPVAGRNYEVLLNRPSRLHYLSLARCKLDDADCAKLAALLEHPLPASKTLHVLLLASNRIGDIGARALANTLRNNRGLHYLSLAGNNITDSGAISIFTSLMEFCLTNDELIEKRLRHFEYLKLRADVYARCIKELNEEKSQHEMRVSRRRTINRAQRISVAVQASSANAIYQKADTMTTKLIGMFNDPFTKDQTMIRAGQLYCIGNMSLCGLNLSYNHLEYTSLTSLYEVLTHQSWLGARANTGLLRVSIEGNNLPIDCDEFLLIEDLLDRAQTAKVKVVKRAIDKSRSSRMLSVTRKASS